ncbi:MAG: AAA family ATPase [Myxococcales bacterium]|nr:AAA family ATPase [Myxococcales bacterium]
MSASQPTKIVRTRVERIFRYLQELHRVRTPPVVRLAERPWRLRLDELPESPQLVRGYARPGDPGSEREVGPGAFVIRVGRPPETDCPEPSVVIKNWLRKGWDAVDADPESIARKTRKSNDGVESFDDSEDRVAALADFLDAKNAWVLEERSSIEALGVFSELFELHVRLQRESEKYQLFLADGILVLDHEAGQVVHPVLIQRVELRFDAGIPEFTILDSHDSPEAYLPLLRHVGLDGDAIQATADALAQAHAHPLGGASTSEFLKDLIQRHWTNGQYFENALEAENASGTRLYRQPQLYLGNRNYGLVENISRYLATIPELEEIPESLHRIVGVDTGRSEERSDDAPPIDLLLTNHANTEQEQVIRRLAETGAVIVQGPPGTGKSHTIANLIGHLLAQDKSILVTSHASKALRVVRDKLAPPLRSLCVSLLESDEESSRQLEESISGIVNYLASTSDKKLTREIERLAESREKLRQEREGLRTRLFEAVKAEYEPLEFLGQAVSPSEAARKLGELRGSADWIPGPLAEDAAPPLSVSELEELYATNGSLTPEDERLLDSRMPELELLPVAKAFAAHYDERTELEKSSLKTGAEFWTHDEQKPESLEQLREMTGRVAEALAGEDVSWIVENDQEWIADCLEAGRAGGERADSWRELVELIGECASEVAERIPLTLEHGPVVESETSPAELQETCGAILEYLEAGKELGKLTLLRKSGWSEFIQSCRVDTGPPTEALQFRAILQQLEIAAFRARLAQRWDRQLATAGAPAFAELGARPEKTAQRHADAIAMALDWFPKTWEAYEARIEELGLDWTRLSRKVAGRSPKPELQRTREIVSEHVEPLIEPRLRFLRFMELERVRKAWLAALEPFSSEDGIYPVVKQLRAGIKKGNYDSYTGALERLSQLAELLPGFERRRVLLEQLAAGAETWAAAIRDRRDLHARAELPGDADLAWRYRQWEQRLTAQARVDLDQLQEKLDTVTERLFAVTADYVEKLSWRAQLQRTGLREQQALNGWLGLHKKIGKGTGKHVGRLKEEAKRTLAECRSAVPVWIMPLSRVVECFDLATTRFDVVIIDEASQSDVLGLVAFALAKEIVVVGDHEQVSPYAVGQRGDRIHGLIDEILKDVPNKHLYDGKTSVYDLARQSFGATIRLVEHFRCVPDIIQFSNHLCYGGEIRALRESTSSRVKPPLVAHRVPRGRESNGINREEALEVAALVSAICRLEEYQNCTIGVICLLGTDQALYIDSVLRVRLTASEYQKRHILCGNASQFQGDERDIMLLSVVNSPAEKPLSLRQRDDAKKVFNVAASRARDQLWVVHSLDPGRDLKHGDLRLRLISHAENPEGLRPRPIKEKQRFNCDLEKGVFMGLKAAGHRVTQRYQVGEYVIDLVVEGEAGSRVGIQCDGDRPHSMEMLAEETDRQATLQRLGWDFVRVRGSEFFRDPEQVLAKLARRLEEFDIRPAPATDAVAEDAGGLVSKVLKRAEMIKTRWKDIPTVNSVRRKAAVEAVAAAEAAAAGEETPEPES